MTASQVGEPAPSGKFTWNPLGFGVHCERQLQELGPKKSDDKLLGTGGALFHLAKSSIGTGILAMPSAFRNGGLWVTLGLALIIGGIYTHCVHILVHSSQVLSERIKQPRLEFSKIAEVAFDTGPIPCRKLSSFARNTVDGALFFTYYAALSAYIVFVSSALRQIISANFDYDMDLRLYILSLIPVVLLIGLIQNLKFLVPLSFLAMCGITLVCGFVLYTVFQGLPPLSSRPAFTSFTLLPLSICTIAFAVDGIGTVLPIANSMKTPENFLGCTGILTVSMIWIMGLYCTMGFFGYLCYGNLTQASITLNLSSSYVSQAVKLMVAINVMISYSLYIFVPSEIVRSKLYSNTEGQKKTKYDYVTRLVLIMGNFVMAVAVPDMGAIVGLIGAIGASTTMFFFPPIIDLITFWNDKQYLGRFRSNVLKNTLILILWLLTITTGTYLNVIEIINLYR